MRLENYLQVSLVHFDVDMRLENYLPVSLVHFETLQYS